MKVHFNANLNTAGSISFLTVSNRVLRLHPLCLAYFDSSSGQAVVLSRLRDCVGELLPPNQIVYKSAFEGADVRYTWTKAAFESDVILLQQPPHPSLYGMDPKSTRLEVWHEWLDAPTPQVRSRLLAREADLDLRSRMIEPDFTDQILDFGDLWFPTGAAYATGGSAPRDVNTAAQIRVPNLGRDPGLVPVGKTFIAGKRTFLIEAVSFPEAQPAFAGLAHPVTPGAAVAPIDRAACLAQLPAPGAPEGDAPPVRMASGSYNPAGCVLDFIEVTGYQDYTFSAETYLVGATYFQGTVTVQSGAVLKYSKGSGRLLCYGAFVFTCSGAAPATLTSEDDDSVGLPLPNSSGCPTCAAEVAIWDYYQPVAADIHGVNIYWARTAVQLDANADPNDPYDCSGLAHSFSYSNIEFCKTGIYANNGTVNVFYAMSCEVIALMASAPWAEGCTYFAGTFAQGGCSHENEAVPGDAMTQRDQPVAIELRALNLCSDDLTFSILPGRGPYHGSLGSVIKTGPNSASVTYTPTVGFEGKDEFYFTVQGCASSDALVTVSVVSAPTLAAECAAGRIILTWTLPSSMEGLSGDFQVYRCASPSGACTPTGTPWAAVSGDVRIFADSDIQDGYTYCYRIVFVHSGSSSLPSNDACAAACPCPIRPGFQSASLPANDDGFTPPVTLPFAINFSGAIHSSIVINNNGNITFGSGLSEYTPVPLVDLGREIIAPFWADVDTRGVFSQPVSYGQGLVGGRSAVGVQWVDVGYYEYHTDKMISAQLVLIDRSDVGNGNFDLEFNYCKVEWETGDASFGQGGLWVGPGGCAARAGCANGATMGFELPASGIPRAFLDSNPTTGLIYHSFNSEVLGRYLFEFRGGVPVATP